MPHLKSTLQHPRLWQEAKRSLESSTVPRVSPSPIGAALVSRSYDQGSSSGGQGFSGVGDDDSAQGSSASDNLGEFNP